VPLGRPTGLRDDGTSCRAPLALPRSREYTIGLAHRAWDGLVLSADLSYRRFLDELVRGETNRVWNSGASPTNGLRDGRPGAIMDVHTAEGLQRRYAGVTIGAEKREGGPDPLVLYARRPAGEPGSGGQPVVRLPRWRPQAPDQDDSRVRFTSWLSTGARYDYYSGRPYSRLYRNDVTGGFDDYRASRGTNPGSNLDDPGNDRPLRLPATQSFNISLRLDWHRSSASASRPTWTRSTSSPPATTRPRSPRTAPVL
jgi:hypothetical protein